MYSLFGAGLSAWIIIRVKTLCQSGKYSNLKDSKSVGAGKKFTSSQKKKIIQQNMEKNGGVIKSDK